MTFVQHLIKVQFWSPLTDRRLVNEPIGASQSGSTQLSEEPCPLKSECLHDGCKQTPDTSAPSPSITKKFGPNGSCGPLHHHPKTDETEAEMGCKEDQKTFSRSPDR